MCDPRDLDVETDERALWGIYFINYYVLIAVYGGRERKALKLKGSRRTFSQILWHTFWGIVLKLDYGQLMGRFPVEPLKSLIIIK